MKKLTKILTTFLFGLVTIFGNAQCPTNINFEQTAPNTYNGSANAYAVTGWTLYGNYANSNTANYNCANLGTPYNLGANEFAIVSTPLTYNSNGGGCSFILGNSPFGGTRVARLGDNTSNYSRNKMSTTFNVTSFNTLFQFAFAGYYENPGHNCCDQPGLYLRVLNACGGNTVASCSSMTLAANCGSLANVSFTQCGTSGVMSNWQVKAIDLTPYIGGCVTIEVWTADCNFGGHYGTTFFDAMCGGQLIGQGLGGISGGPIPGPVSYCSGSGIATIAAPSGYNSYQWYGPNGIIASPQGTMSILTITNPIPGQTYTVQLVSQGGCQLTAVNTLNTSTISIAGIGSSTTCPNGSSGSATVQGNGSGSGYTYTWTNSSNSVVGSSSVAVNLPAGIYSVTIAGLGSAMCGQASATVAVGVGTPQTQNLFKPYCNGQAYLTTSGGTNFQWYLGNTAIQGTIGTAPGYTVTNPSSGQVYNLTYTNLQNCLAQLSYTLISSNPGSVSISATSVCVNGTNGTATIALTPAGGAPPGVNSFSVVNATNTPAYNSSVYPTASNIYTIGGLSAGTYSVQTFDGSCKYNNILNVNTHLFNFTMTPSSATLCQGQVIAAGANFGYNLSGQYQFSWAPSNYLFSPSIQNNLITTSLSPGTSTNITYSITATPTIINCPLTKTMSILMTNPMTPTFVAIPNMCNNGSAYTVQASPSGGTFSIPNGVIIPNSNTYTIGTNLITYSTITNSCSASSSVTFQLNQFNNSTLTSSISPICVTNPTINLMTIVQNTTGVWTGQNVSNNIFNPGGLTTGNYQLTYSTQSYPNASVCPSSSVLSVPVTATLIPNITSVGPFCTNASSFVMTANPSGGVWGSNQSISSGGIITPSLASPQNTLVTYTVNIGPCVNTSSTSIYPSNFISAALTGSVSNLCVSSNPINLMTIVQNTLGSWSGIGVNQNTFTPSTLLTNTYIATYSCNSAPNTTLCPDNSTIAISVYNPQIPNITQVGPFCSQSPAIQLSVTPNTGNWLTSSYLSSTGLFNPSQAPIGNSIVSYIIGTSTCNAQQSKTISVEAYVSSAITNVIPDMCNTGSVINLNPYVMSPGVWSGSGISGSLFNPSTSGTGSIVLTHSTSTSPSGLCPNSTTIAVRVYSLSSPIITSVNKVCNIASPFQIQVTPIGGLFGGFNNSAVSYNGLFNPGFAVIGNNIVNYSITAGPCVAYAQTTINIEKFISADFDKYPNSFYCKGIDQPFNLNSLVQNPGYTWSGPGVIGYMFNPNTANVGYNTITYQTNSASNLCPDTKTISIKVNDIPSVDITIGNNSGCEPHQAIFTTNTNVGKGLWKFGDGLESSELFSSHTYTTAGTYIINFSYQDEDGCPAASKSGSVQVYENPKANFSIPTDILISDPILKVTNKTSPIGSCTYTWEVSNIKYKSNEVNPQIAFSKLGSYYVELVASTEKGCRDVVGKFINVKNDNNISIPGAFTPNDDGLNDVFTPVFTPYGFNMSCYQMMIFDRWGTMIYYTKDINKGWNGKVKGVDVKEDVYVYVVRYCDADNTEHSKIGHVTLLR